MNTSFVITKDHIFTNLRIGKSMEIPVYNNTDTIDINSKRLGHIAIDKFRSSLSFFNGAKWVHLTDPLDQSGGTLTGDLDMSNNNISSVKNLSFFDEISIGDLAGENDQGSDSIAIGNFAGENNQDDAAIAIGRAAGNTDQGLVSVAIGNGAGNNNQGGFAIAIGTSAGGNGQKSRSVAIGNSAGVNSQESDSVAIGNAAGNTSQQGNCIAIGNRSGNDGQKRESVAIGALAGNKNMGEKSIAIGFQAGKTDMDNNCIILNAAGTELNTAGTSRSYIAPIRNALGTHQLYYNPSTKEITYN